MEVKIQKMKTADIETCCSIIMDSEIGKVYFPSNNILNMRLRDCFMRDEIYVAVDNKNTIVGVIWFQIYGAFSIFPFLYMVAINRDNRNKGIGGKLLYFYEEYCLNVSYPKRIATKFFLLVADFNKSAHQFYLNHGYKDITYLDSLYRKNITEIFMMKNKSKV